MQYDVLIIGGGPSGATLGYRLLKEGKSVCIVDKSTFPRDKLCGGLLTEKSVNIIEELYKEEFKAYEQIVNKVEIKGAAIVDCETKFIMTERLKLDNYFIEKFKEAGGDILENMTVRDINHQFNSVKLNSGIEISYKFLVGADGANSQVRRLVDNSYTPQGFGMERRDKTFRDSILIDFCGMHKGYAWSFPKSGYTVHGIGGLKEDNDFSKYTRMYPEGACIPYGNPVKVPTVRNIFLIGDAAGLVDPLTGEGIYFALLSAKYCCNTLVRGDSYTEAIKYIHSRMNDSMRMRKVLDSEVLKRLGLLVLKCRPKLVKLICSEILAKDSMTYSHLVRHILHIPKIFK